MKDKRKTIIHGGYAEAFRGDEHNPGLWRLVPVRSTEDVFAPMVLLGYLKEEGSDTPGAAICRTLSHDYQPDNLGAMSPDYEAFCDVYFKLEASRKSAKAEPSDVDDILNNPFLVNCEPVEGAASKLAELCGAKGHICTIKLPYPEKAAKTTRDMVHGQAVIAQFRNYLLLANGVICFVNWWAMIRQAGPRFMLPNHGRVDLKLAMSDNKLHRTPAGEPDEGFFYIELAEFMGNPLLALKLDCSQCTTLEELIERKKVRLNELNK